MNKQSSRPFRTSRGSLAQAVLLGILLSQAARAGAQGTVETADGLRLSLSAEGAVSNLSLQGKKVPSTSLSSGFLVREVQAKPVNLAPNPSFEVGSGRPAGWSWRDTDAGSWIWDPKGGLEDSRAMKLVVPGTTPKRGPALTSEAFLIQPNTPYTVSCEVRTEGLSRGLDIYLVEQDDTGKLSQRGRTSRAGTNDWSSVSFSYTSGPAAVRGYFKIEVYSGSGTAWADDVKMIDLFGGRAPVPFKGRVTADGDGLYQTGAVNGMDLSARLVSVGNAIRVDATLTDATAQDRAVELSFRLPLSVEGWLWNDSFVTARPIAPRTRYETLDTTLGAQAYSRYPFATVRTTTTTVSLAVPMGPKVQRFSYDTKSGFGSTWDLGLSPAASKTPSRAQVSFWIYTHDPRWGFRSAAERYYALDSESFRSVPHSAGSWIIGADEKLHKVPNPRDFGWGYHEMSGDLRFDDANGFLALRYVDASGWFRTFPRAGKQPSYDELVAGLEADAAAGRGSDSGMPIREGAQATIASSAYDEQGKYQTHANAYFWYGNRMQIYPVSPDPDIPAPSIWSVITKYWIDRPFAEAAARGHRLGGIFLDDITSVFAAVENYRRSLWAFSDVPLSFSLRSGKVVLYDGFSMAEFCKALRDHVHKMGMVLFGSVGSGSYVWFARDFDALGGEVRGAEPLDAAYLRRTLSYGKSWSNLLVPPPGGLAPSQEQVAAYLSQALLLGYFPGFNGVYWQDSTAYERDRPLFRRYIPLIRLVAEAGWRPVPGATSSDPAIIVERFDSEHGKVLYLTAFNSGSSLSAFHLTLEGAFLALREGGVSVEELVRDRKFSVSRAGTNVVFADKLGAGETALYRITAPRQPRLRREPEPPAESQ